MARPHPVVLLAAEIADARSRSIDETHVLDLKLLLEPVLLPAEIGAHVAAAVGLLLARLDQCGAVGLQAVVARTAFELVGTLEHRSGDIAQILDHVDAAAGGGGKFVTQRLREKAVGEVVVLGRGIVLERTGHAVVIGGDKAFRREERRRTAAQRCDRRQRGALEIAQRGRIEFEAGGLHFVGNRAGLAGQPHAFIGKSGSRHADGQDTGPGKQEFLHGKHNLVIAAGRAPPRARRFAELTPGQGHGAPVRTQVPIRKWGNPRYRRMASAQG